MRFAIILVAAVLAGPALAQNTAPAGRAAPGRDCQPGTAACADAPGRGGSAGPARDRAGSDVVPQVKDAAKDANPGRTTPARVAGCRLRPGARQPGRGVRRPARRDVIGEAPPPPGFAGIRLTRNGGWLWRRRAAGCCPGCMGCGRWRR
ncbi:hypothetical protein [Dankookia sp. P2]|uniref:hypothetical protein n=1 Tax=Dankookia sp. P2 TaxID=3423955 RepID=UPI003D6709F3